MTVEVHNFKLTCDEENCNNKLVVASADEMKKKGWSVHQEGYFDVTREWIEVGDKCFCPSHYRKGGLI